MTGKVTENLATTNGRPRHRLPRRSTAHAAPALATPVDAPGSQPRSAPTRVAAMAKRSRQSWAATSPALPQVVLYPSDRHHRRVLLARVRSRVRQDGRDCCFRRADGAGRGCKQHGEAAAEDRLLDFFTSPLTLTIRRVAGAREEAHRRGAVHGQAATSRLSSHCQRYTLLRNFRFQGALLWPLLLVERC